MSNADYVRIQWEGAPLIRDPDGWGCAACHRVFPMRQDVIEHIKDKQLVADLVALARTSEAIELLRTVPPDMELLHGEEYAKAEAWWDRREALLAHIDGTIADD